MATKIQLRRDTAANWTTANPTLAQGEAGFETDTGKLKIGDGTKTWTALGYVSGGASVTVGTTAPTAPADGAMWFDTNGTGTLKVYWGSNPVGASWENSTDSLWTRTGTALAPTTTGDTVQISGGTAALPGLTPVGDPNTGIYSPGADQVAISTNGTGRVFVNSDGTVSVGNALTPTGITSLGLRVSTNTGVGNVLVLSKSSDGTNPPNLTFCKSRGTAASPTAVTVNDVAGSVFGTAYDGSTHQSVAGLQYVVESLAGSNDISGNIQFQTRSSGVGAFTQERMRITSDGKVGVGTATPAHKLSVEGTTYADSSISLARFTTTAGSSQEVIFRRSNSDTQGTNAAVGTGTKLGGILFSGANGTTYQPGFGITSVTTSDWGTGTYSSALVFKDNASDTECARIDSSGRLLVGTSSSVAGMSGLGAQLQVNEGGGVAASLLRSTNDSSGANLVFRKTRDTTTTGATVVQSGDSLGNIYWMGTDGTNAISAAQITAAVDGTPGANAMPARLMFSTTADGASSPTERMRITSTGRATGFTTNDNCLILANSAAAGQAIAFIYGAHTATAVNSGTTSFAVFTNGDIQNTNNSYGAYSDVKLKENIVNASSQWDDLKALRVVNYNFRPETGAETYKQLGLIAQEVELVSPGLVSESPDRDAEGNDLGTVTKSVNYSVLYMKAVKALQEAMERIETLEAKVAALTPDTGSPEQ